MKLIKTHFLRFASAPLLALSLLALTPICLAAKEVAAARTPAGAIPGQNAVVGERLLNGLSFFILPQPGRSDVSLFLRIHSGAAFDLKGKEGTTELLARSLFPDENTRTYVQEELGGRLDITTDYDAITVKLSGRADTLETLVELLRNAFATNTTVDAATLDKLRAQPPAATSPATIIAERAAARRLFGEYPLGRPATGTPESLTRITRADLIFARERFLTADNATLIISGAVEPSRTRALLRQYLGSWRKSDQQVRATFRQPLPPRSSTLLVEAPGTLQPEIRLTLRAPARFDRDYAAAQLLASIVRARWLKAATTDRAPLPPGRLEVSYDAYKLAGLLTMRASAPTAAEAAFALAAARGALQALATTAPPTVAEVESARAEILAAATTRTSSIDAAALALLDAQTYGANAENSLAQLRGVVPTDVRQLAANLFDANSLATIAAGDAAQLRSELTRAGFTVETPEETATMQAAPANPRPRSKEVPVSPLIPAAPPAPAKRP